MDVAPRHIGVVGGMGPEATHAFIGHVLSIARSTYGAARDADYPRMSIENLPLPGLTAQGFEEQEAALDAMTDAIALLARRGAEVIAIPCNTTHTLHDQLQANVPVQVLNILEETITSAASAGGTRAYILGTCMTVQEKLHQLPATGRVEVTYPSEALQTKVESLITRLESGPDAEYAESIYLELITEARSMGADTLILGCTELSISPPSNTQGLICIDSSRVLAEQLLAHAYRAIPSSPKARETESESLETPSSPYAEAHT